MRLSAKQLRLSAKQWLKICIRLVMSRLLLSLGKIKADEQAKCTRSKATYETNRL
jgi:hypothetical protein